MLYYRVIFNSLQGRIQLQATGSPTRPGSGGSMTVGQDLRLRLTAEQRSRLVQMHYRIISGQSTELMLLKLDADAIGVDFGQWVKSEPTDEFQVYSDSVIDMEGNALDELMPWGGAIVAMACSVYNYGDTGTVIPSVQLLNQGVALVDNIRIQSSKQFCLFFSPDNRPNRINWGNGLGPSFLFSHTADITLSILANPEPDEEEESS